jgi:S-adenosylmethionine synthetase
MADQISDTILDALLADDIQSRVAVETLLTTGLVVVAGEVTTTAYAPIAELVRKKILEIGYDSSLKGFDGHSCGVQVAIGGQSGDIGQGVDSGHESRTEGSVDPLDQQGAGDQGLMFGYACDDTPELMPLPIMLAHRLSQKLSSARRDGTMSYLRPDGDPVTIEYDDRTVPSGSTPSWSPPTRPTSTSPDAHRHPRRRGPGVDSFDIPSGATMLVNPPAAQWA